MPENAEDPLLLIGQLATACDTTVRAIEVYLSRKLIAPARRAGNSYRYFHASLEEPIRAFGAMLALGVSLREVAEVFAESVPLQRRQTPDQARAGMIRACETYQRRLAKIDNEAARLRGMRDLIEVRLRYCTEQLSSGKPVQMSKPSAPIRRSLPGRVEYQRR